MHIKNNTRASFIFIIFYLYSLSSIGQVHVSGNSDYSFFTNSKGIKKIKGIAWQFKTEGNGGYIPLIVDDVIYSGDDQGNLYAISCTTGKEIWRFATHDKLYNGPSIKDKIAIIGTAGGAIYGIDIATGKEKWKLKTFGSVCCPPAIVDSLGYALSHDKKMYIFNIYNGSIIETVKEDHILCSTPAVANQKVIYPDWGGNLHSRNLHTLAENWSYNTYKSTKWFTSPSIQKDSIAYFVNNDSTLYCLDIKIGKVNWQYKAKGKVSRAPSFDGKIISFTTTDSHLYVLNSTGALLWEFKSSGMSWSHTILDREMIYLGTGDSHLYAFDKFSNKVKWRFKSNAAVNTPVLHKKAIYFTSGRLLTKLE